MKSVKLVIATILILTISLTTFMYFRKQPVESIPKRATLVFNDYKAIEKEVDIYVGLTI